jgi:phosphate starvation-inducible PhoH-like protein
LKDTYEVNLDIEKQEDMLGVFGCFDENIKTIEKCLNVKVVARDRKILLIGEKDNADYAKKVLIRLSDMVKQGDIPTSFNVKQIISAIKDNEKQDFDLDDDIICLNAKGKPLKCKTKGQSAYVKAICNNSVAFGVGPAGTGKTFLAVAMAINALKSREVQRIILSRPAVEAGEKLGFLPGDLQDKVDPYLKPLYDALYDLIGGETYLKYIEKGVIEIAPLAYMRGRTLEDAFIILDEAQNTTPEQMKMFLTRMGFGSKMVITGDITQTDLPYGKKSGLKQAITVLDGVEGIEIVNLSYKDVVRHEIVQNIINAYDKFERSMDKQENQNE